MKRKCAGQISKKVIELIFRNGYWNDETCGKKDELLLLRNREAQK